MHYYQIRQSLDLIKANKMVYLLLIKRGLIMKIRKATINDLEELTMIEKICFPAAEAASKETFEARLKVFKDYFWLLEKDGKIVSFINGMVINETTIRDEMFEDASMHDDKGLWQAIFGVNTLPQYQHLGFARKVMEAVIQDAKKQGRKGCVLTCKEKLITFYEKFGYVNQGISKSVHGGAVWYDMILEFKDE